MLCNENVPQLLEHVPRYVLLPNCESKTLRQGPGHGLLLLLCIYTLTAPHLPQALLLPLILA